jgi:DNA topoisomerase-1
MKSLIIVESVTKSKTIKKYLNDSNILLTYTCGHIYNLPKDRLGINYEDWTIENVPINIKIINNIKKMASECDVIFLASDPDLEGEAIAYNLKDIFKNNTKKCYRITFNEITKSSILNAIDNPRDIDMEKVQAQETRRIVDRLIGYKISPLLWSYFNCNYLSAGRVQIAALIICINQRVKILNKEITKYSTIKGTFKVPNKNIKFDASLYKDYDNIWKYTDHNDVIKMLNEIEINKSYKVSYNKKTRKLSPPPPYTTTTMQQDAYNKLKYSAKYTMKLAQDLYENGLITYMRTDSTNISNEAKNMILKFINDKYGNHQSQFRNYKTKIVNAQEAHEAIRITDPSKNLKMDCYRFEGCTDKHEKLYDMIWKRSVASFMIDAEYIDLDILFNDNHLFIYKKSFLIKEGFQILYNIKNDEIHMNNIIENLKEQFYLIKLVSDCNIDNIPSMYNEVQLIKELEKDGIGRPSTYASILEKLLEKKYIELGQNPQQTIDVECYEKKIMKL